MDFWTDAWTGPRTANKVYVIAENERDAAAGLRTAEKIARDMNRSIVLAIPHFVPYGIELDGCCHDLKQIGNGFRHVAESTGVSTEVRVCACREARHLFDRMLIDEAVVVIPGHRGRWVRSRSERLAHALTSQGHTVTFADADRPLQEDVGAAPAVRPPAPRIVSRSGASRRA
jgi:hypothetical protein